MHFIELAKSFRQINHIGYSTASHIDQHRAHNSQQFLKQAFSNWINGIPSEKDTVCSEDKFWKWLINLPIGRKEISNCFD